MGSSDGFYYMGWNTAQPNWITIQSIFYRPWCLLIALKCQKIQDEQRSTGSGELIGTGTWSLSRSLIYIRLRSVITQIHSMAKNFLWVKPECNPVSYHKTANNWNIIGSTFIYFTAMLNRHIVGNESMFHHKD